jgi:hypothetical protein
MIGNLIVFVINSTVIIKPFFNVRCFHDSLNIYSSQHFTLKLKIAIMDAPKLIPTQKHGASTDTISKIKLASIEEALWEFEIIKDRLMAVSKWHELSGEILAKFQLINTSGVKLSGPAKEGDYIRINIPGPKNKSGDGYDWVRIEKIESFSDESKSLEVVAIKVRPCKSPRNNEQATAHFFKDIATSTFLVKRSHTTISAEVHGRNEETNTDAPDFNNKVRNFFVGLGAMLGFSKVQWKSLVDGLIKLY